MMDLTTARQDFRSLACWLITGCHAYDGAGRAAVVSAFHPCGDLSEGLIEPQFGQKLPLPGMRVPQIVQNSSGGSG